MHLQNKSQGVDTWWYEVVLQCFLPQSLKLKKYFSNSFILTCKWYMTIEYYSRNNIINSKAFFKWEIVLVWNYRKFQLCFTRLSKVQQLEQFTLLNLLHSMSYLQKLTFTEIESRKNKMRRIAFFQNIELITLFLSPQLRNTKFLTIIR